MEKRWDKTLRKPWRYIFSIVVTMVLHIYLYTANPEKKTITFLHVGQGDSSVFVSESGTVCLFDGGSTSIESPGKYIILPYLKYRGIACIDYIILSHSDEDHINGIGEIIEDKSLKVRNIILPTGDDGFGEIEAMAENNKINIIRADSEMGIEGNDFKIDFINPLKRYEGQYKDKNDNSLGAVIEMNGVKAAMTGDIGETAEEWIMEGENLSNVDILKVPHHGSKHSSSEAFLECMQPKLAVISCGENNSYGHPHKETVDRLMKLGTVIYETYVRGAVTVRVYGEQMEIEVFCN